MKSVNTVDSTKLMEERLTGVTFAFSSVEPCLLDKTVHAEFVLWLQRKMSRNNLLSGDLM